METIDHSHLRLGKKRVRRDRRSMRLETYLKELPPLAPTRDLTEKVGADWGMMLNDQLGDCTIAGLGHFIMACVINNGKQVTIPNASILKRYSDWCGYVEGQPATDQGGVELDVLNSFRKDGIEDADGKIHKALAHVLVEARNHQHVKACVDMFGGAYFGLEMPSMWQTMDVWKLSYSDGDATPGSWGGHCVVAEAYDDDGLTIITWGMKKRLTWDALDVYGDDKNGGEVHAILSEDWASKDNPCPDGFDIDLLQSDLLVVTG